MENLEFTKDNITFTFTKISKIEGHTEISIRKSKQICIFEYSAEIDFRGETDSSECEGSFKLSEINESDMDFHITNVNVTKKGEIGDQAKMVLKKNVRKEIENKLTGLLEEIREIDR